MSPHILFITTLKHSLATGKRHGKVSVLLHFSHTKSKMKDCASYHKEEILTTTKKINLFPAKPAQHLTLLCCKNEENFNVSISKVSYSFSLTAAPARVPKMAISH